MDTPRCLPPQRHFTEPVIKTLFALSGNRCAFDGCEEHLTRAEWPAVNADIAHIVGLRHGSARHACDHPDVNGFENLLLLCKNHHHRVDTLEPHRWSVDDLRAMKERAASRAETWQHWTTEERLNTVVAMMRRTVALSGQPDLAEMTPPSLNLVRRGMRLMLVNGGQLAAFEWSIDPRNDMESFDRGVSFEEMQSWEHNEHGPIPGMEERQIGEVTDAALLKAHPEPVIVRWSNSMGEAFSSVEMVTWE